MTEEPKPAPSKIIPNSFQKPNWVVDVVMRYLPGEHYKCLDVVIRKTLGWMKERDRIARTQIVDLVGMNVQTVDKCMKELCAFGLVIKVDGNNAKNQGNEYALQMDDRQIDLSGLMAWAGKRKDVNKRRGGISSYKPGVARSHTGTPVPPYRGSTVAPETQKPLSKANKEEDEVAQKPNLFKVYEQEIGAITPLIADALKDAEKEYPPGWVEEAIQIAVERNVRNWKYVRAVLEDCKAKKVSPKLNTKGKSNAKLNQSSSKPTAKPSAQPDQSVVDEINRRRREKGVR